MHEIEELPELEYASAEKEPEPGPSAAKHDWTAKGWLLLEKRKLLSKVFVRALVISTVVVFLIPSRYESTARIMPPEQGGGGGALLSLLAGRIGSGSSGSSSSGGGSSSGSSAGLSSLAGDFLGVKTSAALYTDLLRSRTVQEHIVDRFHLKRVYWDWYKEDARKDLDSRTDVVEDRKSGVLKLTVSDTKRERAREIAQAYLDELDRLLSQVSTSSARRERMFIEQRLVAVKADLEQAEKDFSAFASKNTALDIKEQGKAMVEAAAVLQGQLMAAQSELQGIQQIYSPNNIRVKSLKARVSELQNQLQKFGGTDASLVPDVPGAAASQDPYPSIRKLPLLGVEWADLYRKAKIQETVFEMLTQQYEMARIQEAKEVPTVRVFDPPNVPEKTSWPPRFLIILGSTLLFTLGTAFLVITSERWRNTNSQDPRKLLAISIWEKSKVWGERTAVRLHIHGLISRLRRNSPK
ncbi:MAG: lipopolysaccharide biosynthesis protein [Acidobacteriota bacterium]|nr:lipopolysaccharide biosynthesis protein [Acidobacteriota bacterium]